MKALSNMSKLWLMVAILLAPVLVNEIIVALASMILGIGYHPLPVSIQTEIAMVREGYVWSLLLALVLLISIIAGVIGACLKNSVGIGFLGFPVCFLVGSILGNGLFAMMNHESFYLSPFAMFWMYLGVVPTAQYHWIIPVYLLSIGLSLFFLLWHNGQIP